jgi:hypothetical protein
MADYWESDFMPLNVFTLQFWQWIFIAAARTFGNLLNFYAYQMQSWWLYLYTLVYFILGVLAIFHLIFRKRWLIVYLLVFPILLHLLTSSIQRYPFNTRLILYLYPMMITLIAYGLKILATKLEALSKFKSLPYLTTALILLVVPVEMLRIYPLEREEIKKSLQYIQDNVSVGQKIYVHSAADRAFEYYEETGFFSVGNEQIRGSVGTYDWSKYNHDINRLSGQVWFLFSHINPYYQAVSAEDYFLANLGKEWSLMDKYKARGSSVYLYERIVQEEIIQYQKKEQ